MTSVRELICIVCPQGCTLQAEHQADTWTVSGYACKRGLHYALDELDAPKRMVSTSLPVVGGEYAMVSVRPDAPIPKDMVMTAMQSLQGVSLAAPVKRGQVVIENWLQMGVNLIATRTVYKAR